jgi:hypothetical protein
MDGARDELLADAALALNQHRGVGRRRAADGAHHLPQPGAVPDHLVPDFDRFLQRPVLVAELPLIEGVAEADEHTVARERLLDEIERAFLRRFDGGADRAVAGDDDHRQRIVHGAQSIEDLEPVHAGHLHIEQHQVRPLALREREPFLARRGADELVPFVFEGHLQRIANGGLVVNDQNA